MKLLPEKYGQAEVMTVTDGPDVSVAECGHWYSPAAVARFVEEEREAGAKVCEEQASEPECPERAQYCADAIRMRSNVK